MIDPSFGLSSPAPLSPPPGGANVPPGVSALAEQRLASALGILADGEANVAGVVAELLAAAAAALGQHYNAVGLAIDQVIGKADNDLYRPVMDVRRSLDKVATSALTSIAEREGDLVTTGINVPYTIEERQAALADDSGSWAPTVLPGLADYMGTGEKEVITDQAAAIAAPEVSPPVSPPPLVSPPPITSPPPLVSPPPVTSPPPPPATCEPLAYNNPRDVWNGVPPCAQPMRPEAGFISSIKYAGGLWRYAAMCSDVVRDPFPHAPPAGTPPNETQQWVRGVSAYKKNPDGTTSYEVDWFTCCQESVSLPPPPPPPPPILPPPPVETQCCPPQEITVTVPPITLPPPPPPLVCEPEKRPPIPLSDIPGLTGFAASWCQENVCDEIQKELGKIPTETFLTNPRDPGEGPPGTGNFFRDLWGAGRGLVAWFTSGFDIEAADAAMDEASRTLGSWVVHMPMAAAVLNHLSPIGVPDPKAAVALGRRIAIGTTVAKETGYPLDYLQTAERQLLQYANPQYIPSQAELNRAYLADQVTVSQWECLTRANGNVPKCQRWVLSTDMVRPGVSEVIDLGRRGLLDSAAVRSRLRNLGVLDDQHAEEFVKLAQFIPPYTDLIRMMVRESADDLVATQYGYDKNFDTSFRGPIVEWAKAQGISADVFKYLWRAHWQLPSYTQLTEMLFRLRENRPAVDAWKDALAAWDKGGQLGPRPTLPPVVGVADVARALEINDMAPEWVLPLIEIAYRPLTRTDVVRAYEVGAFSDDQVLHALMDEGYHPDNALLLLNFYRIQKARRFSNAADSWSVRKSKRIYKAGGITRGELLARLAPLVPDATVAAVIADDADAELKADAQTHQIKAIRKAYLFGEESRDRTINILRNFGLADAQVAALVAAWDGDKEGRLKEPTVRMLGTWYRRGAISGDQFRERLLRLGYTRDDVSRIVYAADVEESERQAARFEKLMRELKSRIKDAQAAKRAAAEDLKKVLKESEAQAHRIRQELNRRAREEGRPEPYPGE